MSAPTVGSFLFDYLHKLGVTHVFGIPGDFALPIFRCMQQSPLKTITMTHEPSVGFAADGYARIHGLGVACVTYCVGGLNMLNSVACAYAEKSPVLVISGGPSPKDRAKDILIHHKVRTFDTQQRIYAEVTCANAVLLDPETAAAEIMRVVSAVLEHSRPGYLEIPFDVVDMPIPNIPPIVKKPAPVSNSENLQAMLDDATATINQAKQPIIVADVELNRYNLVDEAVALATKFNIPIASTLMSKSLISESHPLFIGVYSGPLSEDVVRNYVDTSDCVIMLGALLTDVWFGFTRTSDKLSRKNTMLANVEKMQIGARTYENVVLKEFLEQLRDMPITPRQPQDLPRPTLLPEPLAEDEKSAAISIETFFRILGLHMGDSSTVTCDTGDALFGAIKLCTKKTAGFPRRRLLPIDGFRGSRRHRRDGGQARKPRYRHCRRWCVPDDRHRAFHRRQIRHEAHRVDPQQRRVRHATFYSRRAVQRNFTLELYRIDEIIRRGGRAESRDQRRIGIRD